MLVTTPTSLFVHSWAVHPEMRSKVAVLLTVAVGVPPSIFAAGDPIQAIFTLSNFPCTVESNAIDPDRCGARNAVGDSLTVFRHHHFDTITDELTTGLTDVTDSTSRYHSRRRLAADRRRLCRNPSAFRPNFCRLTRSFGRRPPQHLHRHLICRHRPFSSAFSPPISGTYSSSPPSPASFFLSQFRPPPAAVWVAVTVDMFAVVGSTIPDPHRLRPCRHAGISLRRTTGARPYRVS